MTRYYKAWDGPIYWLCTLCKAEKPVGHLLFDNATCCDQPMMACQRTRVINRRQAERRRQWADNHETED